LVVDNLPLVGYLVSELCARVTHLSRDDYASVGALALVTAADAYKPELGIPFGAYARTRITGAFADEMRSSDWASRGTRKRIKETLAVQESLSAAFGRAATVDEIAGALGVSKDDAQAALADAARTVTTLDDVTAELLRSDRQSPEEAAMESERAAFLRRAVDALPERLALIVRRIYFEDQTVGQVADELGISHSAVSQQRGEAMRLMRDGIHTHYEGTRQEPDAKLSASRRSAYLARLAQQAVAGVSEAGLQQRAARPAS
jgi:RNA polymerase sigma factor for flagellar operon FliA